jgi:hypothetical protein
MYATRTKPTLGRAASGSASKPGNDSISCIWTPVLIVVSYIILSAIIRVTSNAGSQLDQIICYGTLVVFVVIMLLGARDMRKDKQAAAAERRQWQLGCTSAQVSIVGRRYSPSMSVEDGYGKFHSIHSSYELDIGMSADQRAAAPNQTSVKVVVDSLTYEKLKNRNTVRIYYKPEAPLTFLLEEEI